MTAPVPTARAKVGAVVDDWILTAPWWHWPRQSPRQPADTLPALQKYATPQLVDEFLADPQRRLVFDSVADVTRPATTDPKTLQAVLSSTAGALRKLYLATHHRHYLVAVELHCARPGLPSPSRDDVCEAAFVIRRRRAEVRDELGDAAREHQRRVARAQAQLSVIDRRLTKAAVRGKVGVARLTALTEQRHAAAGRHADAVSGLQEWARANGIERTLEGWVPLAVDPTGALAPLPERPDAGHRPLPGLGRWVPVDEIGATLEEATFPLYPLVADPTKPHHDGAGRTIYYGVIPTITSDLQQLDPEPPGTYAKHDDPPRLDRTPRLDDLSTYEIRCVVRHHDPRCPRRQGERDCRGPLTWSAATAPFRLAGPFDGRGTANRPVTVRLPSRAELAEGAGLGGVRVAAADYPTNPDGSGQFQICSFAIPLITIVATFVLRLFLPIVVFVLGLWALLALKLCIPPSVSVSADVEAALNASGPSAGLDISADLDIAANFAAQSMGGGLSKSGLAPDPSPDFAAGIKSADPSEQFGILRALATNSLRTPSDDLVYEPRVERAEVLGR